MTQHIARILSDIASVFGGTKDKPNYYGREKEIVTIVDYNKDVCIVENKNGQRYPIRTIKLEKIEI